MASYRDFGYNAFLIRSINASDPLGKATIEGEEVDSYTDLGFTYDLTASEMVLPSWSYDWNLPQYSVSEINSMFPDYSIPSSSLSSYIGQLQQFWKWISDEAAVAGAGETAWLAPTSNSQVPPTGTGIWVNPTYAYSSNDAYTTCAPPIYNSRKLGLGTFDFSSVPAGATIVGVALLCEYYKAGTASEAALSFAMSFGNTPNNDQFRWPNSYWPDAESTISLGGNGDTWELPITMDNIDSLTAWVHVYRPFGPITFSVDYLALKIYYTT